MAHISFLSNFFGRKAHASAILRGRHFMYGDVWLFLFITADRTLEASRLQNYLKTETKHGGVVVVRSLSAKYRPDRYRRDKSVKFGTELP